MKGEFGERGGGKERKRRGGEKAFQFIVHKSVPNMQGNPRGTSDFRTRLDKVINYMDLIFKV